MSELTPFLRSTRYYAHLDGVAIAEVLASIQLPSRDDKPILATIYKGVDRVLRKVIAVLDYDTLEEIELSALNIKVLNTFRRDTLNLDPIKPLQDSSSR